MMRVLELENHRGETPLFLASVAGNHVRFSSSTAPNTRQKAAVDALLQSGVDYTSAYMPDIKVPSHAPAFVRVQVRSASLFDVLLVFKLRFGQDLINSAREFQEHITQRAEPRRGIAVGTTSLLSRLLVVTRRRSANANASAALLASLRASPPTALVQARGEGSLTDVFGRHRQRSWIPSRRTKKCERRTRSPRRNSLKTRRSYRSHQRTTYCSPSPTPPSTRYISLQRKCV